MEIVGRAPELAGLLCEAFICEGFTHNGKTVANANVVYICFAGAWHKLVLDCGVIIWGPSSSEPSPWKVASEGWEYPHVDLGVIAGVVGHRLKEYRMTATATGSKVTFLFDRDCTITIDNENDRSTYQID